MKKNAAYAMSTPAVVCASGQYVTDVPAAVASAMGPITMFGDPTLYEETFSGWFA